MRGTGGILIGFGKASGTGASFEFELAQQFDFAGVLLEVKHSLKHFEGPAANRHGIADVRSGGDAVEVVGFRKRQVARCHDGDFHMSRILTPQCLRVPQFVGCGPGGGWPRSPTANYQVEGAPAPLGSFERIEVRARTVLYGERLDDSHPKKYIPALGIIG